MKKAILKIQLEAKIKHPTSSFSAPFLAKKTGPEIIKVSLFKFVKKYDMPNHYCVQLRLGISA